MKLHYFLLQVCIVHGGTTWLKLNYFITMVYKNNFILQHFREISEMIAIMTRSTPQPPGYPQGCLNAIC